MYYAQGRKTRTLTTELRVTVELGRATMELDRVTADLRSRAETSPQTFYRQHPL